MTEEIQLAMQTCEENPASGENTLQALMKLDRDRFVRASLPLLQSDHDAPGYKSLMKLLVRSDQLVNQLCNPDCFSREASIELARQMVQFEPLLDTRLVHLLPGRDSTLSNPANCATIERILELLEVVSSSARIVPPLAHLLRDPNPRLRAKAALLIGRRVGNSTLAESCLQQADPRVRANAIESLWGGGAPSAAVLWMAAKDTNNRVAGNALLGLYRLQDQSAAGHIIAMAAHPQPLFRATAGWTMGQTSDPRFLPALENLARDLYALVRRNATKSLESIRNHTNSAAALQLHVLRQEGGRGLPWSVSIQALGPDGDPARSLLPSQFILWADGNLVTDYKVTEHANAACLFVGFALCPGQGISGELLSSAEEAVLGCLNLKAQKDHWAVAKFVSTREQPDTAGGSSAVPVRPDPGVEPAVYLSEVVKLEKNIAESAIETQFALATLAAFRSLLSGAAKVRGDRHLIILTASDFIISPEIEAQADNAAANKVAIHAVAVGKPHPSLRNLCQRTGGILVSAAGAAELAAAFSKLYLALMGHYEIRFLAEPPVKLEVNCEQGYGTCRLELSDLSSPADKAEAALAKSVHHADESSKSL